MSTPWTLKALHHIAGGWCAVGDEFSRLGSPMAAGEAYRTAAKWEQMAVVLLLKVRRKREVQPTLGILAGSLVCLLNRSGQFYQARRWALRALRWANNDGFAEQRISEALEQARACIKWQNRLDKYGSNEPGPLRLPPECRPANFEHPLERDSILG